MRTPKFQQPACVAGGFVGECASENSAKFRKGNGQEATQAKVPTTCWKKTFMNSISVIIEKQPKYCKAGFLIDRFHLNE